MNKTTLCAVGMLVAGSCGVVTVLAGADPSVNAGLFATVIALAGVHQFATKKTGGS